MSNVSQTSISVDHDTWAFSDGGRLLQVLPAPELSFVGSDAARQRTKSLHAAHAASHFVHVAVSVFVPSVCSVCSVRLLSCPFRFHSWPCCSQLGLRYEPLHLAVRRAVLQPGGTPSNKPSGALCLVLRQLILRPGRSETSVERLSLSWVRHVSMRGKAPHAESDGAQLHHISSMYFFLFLKIGRRNPLRDLTPLPIRAGSLLLAQALLLLVSAVGSFFTYIWIHASGACGDVRFPGIPVVNKIGWSPVVCPWTTPPLRSVVLHKRNSTVTPRTCQPAYVCRSTVLLQVSSWPPTAQTSQFSSAWDCDKLAMGWLPTAGTSLPPQHHDVDMAVVSEARERVCAPQTSDFPPCQFKPQPFLSSSGSFPQTRRL